MSREFPLGSFRISMTITAGLLTMLGGCGETQETSTAITDMTYDDHLRCAAMISAFDRQLAQSNIGYGDDIEVDPLVAMMTHLNSYAIPQDLSEGAAFDALHKKRDAIVATQSLEKIRDETRVCLQNVPQG